MASVMIITLPDNPTKEEELNCDIFCHHVKGNPVQKAELQTLYSHYPVLLRALHHQLPPLGPHAADGQEAAHRASGLKNGCLSWYQGSQ